jgi:hypothetical protein
VVVVMRRRAVVAAVPLVVSMGCRLVAGLHDHEYVADGGCTSQPLPSTGNARIRLVNAGTQGQGTDLCMRPAGTSDWGAPLLGNIGSTCQPGLAYAQVTVPFAVDVGAADFEAVPGGAGCAAPATSQALGVTLGDSTQGAPVVTLVRMAGGASPEQLVALPEENTPNANSAYRIRVVNALATVQPIDFGLAAAGGLPTSISSTDVVGPIAPGSVAPVGSWPFGAIDAEGYFSLTPSVLPLGVSLHASPDALLVIDSTNVASTQTLYAIGDASNATHFRGLLCEENVPTAGSDAGASGSPPDPLAECTLSPLPTLAIDTVSASLYGASAPFESDRRAAVIAKVAARQADLMCIVDVNREEDKTSLIAAAKANGYLPFAYSTEPPTTLDTQPDDSSGADGGTPPPLAGPPCGGTNAPLADAALSCATSSCSTTGGVIPTTSCLSSECAASLLQLYNQGYAKNACFDCLIYTLASAEPITQAQDCETDSRRPFAFDGQTTQVILSHYPLSNERTYVLPATGYRRVVLYAEVTLENQSTIDFYCAQLSSPGLDTSLPYTGAYGMDGKTTLADGGVVDENGWEDEQDLQVERAIAFIQKTSAATGRHAIIAGDWEASARYPAAPAPAVVNDTSPEVLASLGNAFTLAEPPGFVPVCTYCPAPQNPYNAGAAPVYVMPTFLLGFAAGATTADDIWGTEADVAITADGFNKPPPSGTGPAFETYPHEVRVIRPEP